MAAAVEGPSARAPSFDGPSAPRPPKPQGPNTSPLPPVPSSNGPVDHIHPATQEQVNQVLSSDIGINTLLGRLKQSISTARDFASFLKERCILEDKHAQGLKRLSRNTNDLIRRPENRQGTFAANYEELNRIHDRMADHGLQFANTLFAMSEELNELAVNSEKGRKHWKHTGLNAETRVQDAESAMEKAKAKYNGLAEQYDRARTGEKQAGMFGLKKSGAQQEEELHRKLEAADSDYAAKVQAAQAQRHELLTMLRPQTVHALQEIINETDAGVSYQVQRLAFLSEKLLLGYGLSITPLKGQPGSPTGAKSLREVAAGINNDADFIEYLLSYSNKSGARGNDIRYEQHPSLSPKQQQPQQFFPQQPDPYQHARQASAGAPFPAQGYQDAHQSGLAYATAAETSQTYEQMGPQSPPVPRPAPTGAPRPQAPSAPQNAAAQPPPSSGANLPGNSTAPQPQNQHARAASGPLPPSQTGARPPRGASLGQSMDAGRPPPADMAQNGAARPQQAAGPVPGPVAASGAPAPAPAPVPAPVPVPAPANRGAPAQNGPPRPQQARAPQAPTPATQPAETPQTAHPPQPRPPPAGGISALPSRAPRAGPPVKPVFGVSLDELFQRDGSAVPTIVVQCVQAVDLYGLQVEGVYRTSGSAHHIMQLRQQFDHDSNAVDFRNASAFYDDIASVTTLLKHFLRDLPDPLLTAGQYRDFIQAAKIDEDIVRRDSIHALVNALPDPNYATLRVITLHLDRVARYSDRNKMTPSNLAIVFAPTLMGQHGGANGHASGDIADAGWQAKVVETILNNTFQIFDDDE